MQAAATKENCNKNDIVLKAVDNVLNQIFGKEATALIYRHIERHYSMKRSEISDKIELFAQGLEDFLRSGAYVVERKILEDINSSCSELYRAELETTESEPCFVAHMKSFMHHA
jgi:hypothetical protein